MSMDSAENFGNRQKGCPVGSTFDFFNAVESSLYIFSIWMLTAFISWGLMVWLMPIYETGAMFSSVIGIVNLGFASALLFKASRPFSYCGPKKLFVIDPITFPIAEFILPVLLTSPS